MRRRTSRSSRKIVAARILEAAGLPVAQGRLARTTEEAVRAADASRLSGRAQGDFAGDHASRGRRAGQLALEDDAGVAKADRAFRARAAELGVTLDGTWVQHMVAGNLELLVTAIRDPQFGVMVGCGMGGAMTEIIDDVAFARAPIDADGAFDLIGCLRTIARLPALLSDEQRSRAARISWRGSRPGRGRAVAKLHLRGQSREARQRACGGRRPAGDRLTARSDR